MKRKEYMLDYYDRVTLKKDVRKGDKTTYTVFPVRLEGRAGAEAVDLEESQDYHEARGTAEDMAKFLGLKMEDSSSGTKVVREADRLDESIREKAMRTGELVNVPGPPPNMRARVRGDLGAIEVEIPSQGLTNIHYLQLGTALVFTTFVLVFFGRFLFGMEIPAPFNFIVIGIFSLLFIALPLLTALRKVLGQARKTQRITASRDMLIVEESGPGKGKVTEIPVDEIEDFAIGKAMSRPQFRSVGGGKYKIEADGEEYPDYSKPGMYSGRGKKDVIVGRRTASLLSGMVSAMAPRGAITARSDRATVSFGKGLRQDELEYIYAKLKNAMMT